MRNLLNSYISFSFLALLSMILVVYFNLPLMLLAKYGGDSNWYIAMAEGRINEVIEPYSARFLHTFSAGWLNRIFSLDIADGFLLIAVVSLFVFFLVNGFIFKKIFSFPLLLFPIFLLPYFIIVLQRNIQPDAFYMFLTAIFFLFLFYEMEGASLLILFLLFLSRESTIILGLTLVAVSWFHKKKFLALATFIVVVISFLVSGSISNIGQSNTHNLNPLVFMFLKFPYHFIVNTFGVRLWVSDYDFCAPIFKVRLPSFDFFGSIDEIGFCGFDANPPLRTFIVLFTAFGTAPLILFYILRKRGKEILKSSYFWLPIAIVYGIAHYFIAIPAGTGVSRIVGYGWPAFLLAMPFLVRKFLFTDKKFLIKLFTAYLFVAWLQFFTQKIGGGAYSSNLLIFVLLVVFGAYIYTFRILKNQPIANNVGG